MLSRSFIKRIAACIMLFALMLSQFPAICGQTVVDAATAETVQTSDSQKNTEYKNAEETVTAYASQDTISLVTENYNNSGRSAVIVSGENVAVFNAVTAQAALYEISVEYMPVSDTTGDIELSFLIDGSAPTGSSSVITLRSIYKQESGSFKTDSDGNDIQPKVGLLKEWVSTRINDNASSKRMTLALDAGSHTLSFSSIKGGAAIASVGLVPCEEAASYSDYKNEFIASSDSAAGNAKSIIIEGEHFSYKNSQRIQPVTDRSSATPSPQSAIQVKLNTMGGSNWTQVGDSVTWEFNVKESGIYKIALGFRQNVKDGIFTSRKLLIDGKLLFKEAEAIRFPYSGNWELEYLGSGDDEFEFYFEAGEHTLTLEATMGDMGTMISSVEDAISELNRCYREIMRVTGPSPDVYRDYKFDETIPEVLERLRIQKSNLEKAIKIFEEQGGKGSYTAVLEKTAYQLGQMTDDPSTIAKSFDSFKSNLGSLGTWLLQMTEQPLQLDRIYIVPKEGGLQKSVSFWKNLKFAIESFLCTFGGDYGILSSEGEHSETITVWQQTGRDQADVLRRLVNSSFCPEYKINVKLELVSADSLLKSVMAGMAPDVVLDNASSSPVNLALRNAVAALNDFDDFDETAERFHEASLIPYTYKDKVYGLPQTFSYLMMFYRTDIFEEYGLEAPKTWDEFIKASNIFKKEGLSVGISHDVSTYTMLLYQNGGELYTSGDDGMIRTALGSNTALNSFAELTDFFTLYDIPVAYDFANRFRTGEIPCAIQNFTAYNQLSAYAPEIKGLWQMAPVPGTALEGGAIDNTSIADGTGAVIIQTSRKKDAAWEFLKWFSSAEVQISYVTEMENILGQAGRVATANLEALSQMAWSQADYKGLYAQLESISAVPELPGSYYLSRVLGFAFNRVYNSSGAQNMGEDPADVLKLYVREFNNELIRKQKEFKEK